MPAESEKYEVVVDTSLLLNFLKIGRLDLLCRGAGYRITITEHIRAEVKKPKQAMMLEEAIESTWIEEVTLDDPRGLEQFAVLEGVLGRGEAAAIALAESRGWALGLDEKGRARREAEARLGRDRILNTPGVLLRCIRREELSVEDADRLKDRLAEARFAIRLESFRDLLT